VILDLCLHYVFRADYTGPLQRELQSGENHRMDRTLLLAVLDDRVLYVVFPEGITGTACSSISSLLKACDVICFSG